MLYQTMWCKNGDLQFAGNHFCSSLMSRICVALYTCYTFTILLPSLSCLRSMILPFQWWLRTRSTRNLVSSPCARPHCHPHPLCKHAGYIFILAIATTEGFNPGSRSSAHDSSDLVVWVEYELCAHVSTVIQWRYGVGTLYSLEKDMLLVACGRVEL